MLLLICDIPDGLKTFEPLLIVLRDVGRIASASNAAALQFYSFADSVIETACNGERRGVRVSPAPFCVHHDTCLMVSTGAVAN